MACFINENLSELISGNYIYLDNDFLGEIFRSKDLFELIINAFEKGYWMCDPLTKLEFLRDVYLPEQFEIKNTFLGSEHFSAVLNHQDLFRTIQENALLLSRIYRHQKIGQSIGTIDLLIAGRVMFQFEKALIATGNKKDFPACIFDCIGVINNEQNVGSIKALSVLKFNQEKFNTCNNQLQNL